MMVLSAMTHFIAHLPFMEPDWIHQTQLLEHGKIPIDRHQIGDMTPFPQTRMDLSRRNRQRTALKNLQESLPRLSEFLPTGFQTFENRFGHQLTS